MNIMQGFLVINYPRLISIALIFGMIFTLYVMMTRNKELVNQLADMNKKVEVLELEKATLQKLNEQHNEAIRQLQSKNSELQTAFNERRQSIKQVSKDDKTVQSWGNTAVPDAIKRVFNSERNKDATRQ